MQNASRFFKDRFLSSKRRVFAFGDIHGNLIQLRELVSKIPDKHKVDAVFVFLGDYIDRGPNSKGVIDYLIHLESSGIKCVYLKGNHERMFLDFLEKKQTNEEAAFILNGGGATLASYGVLSSDYSSVSYKHIDEHLGFYKNLKTFYEWGDYFFVHAGVPNRKTSEIKSGRYDEEMAWIRDEWLYGSYSFKKTVVHGHTPTDDLLPFVSKRRICIDTGAGFNHGGGKLSCIELPANKIYSVEIPVKNYSGLTENSNGFVRANRYIGSIPIVLETAKASFQADTVDYNEFGVLCRGDKRLQYFFEKGQMLSGNFVINMQEVPFFGDAVMTEVRASEFYIAIKFTTPVIFADKS